MNFAVPQIAREGIKRLTDYAFLRLIKHKGVMYHATPALNIVFGVAWIRPPGGLSQQKAHTCPRVNSYAAVTQIGYSPVKLRAQLFDGRRVD